MRLRTHPERRIGLRCDGKKMGGKQPEFGSGATNKSFLKSRVERFTYNFAERTLSRVDVVPECWWSWSNPPYQNEKECAGADRGLIPSDRGPVASRERRGLKVCQEEKKMSV